MQMLGIAGVRVGTVQQERVEDVGVAGPRGLVEERLGAVAPQQRPERRRAVVARGRARPRCSRPNSSALTTRSRSPLATAARSSRTTSKSRWPVVIFARFITSVLSWSVACARSRSTPSAGCRGNRPPWAAGSGR